MRDQCVSSGQNHRTLVVGAVYSLLQARRQEMQIEAFKKEMHQRNGIEATQSELTRGYGLRHARYRGQTKVRLQNYLILISSDVPCAAWSQAPIGANSSREYANC